MDAKELRGKSAAELTEELLKLRKEQFALRMQRATGQSPKPDQFTKVRRNIARLKTVQREKERAAAGGKKLWLSKPMLLRPTALPKRVHASSPDAS